MTWRDRALCNGYPDLMMPPGGHEGDDAKLRRWAKALTLCDSCTVADECLLYAQRTRQSYGIWGGHIFDKTHLRRGRSGEQLENLVLERAR